MTSPIHMLPIHLYDVAAPTNSMPNNGVCNQQRVHKCDNTHPHVLYDLSIWQQQLSLVKQRLLRPHESQPSKGGKVCRVTQLPYIRDISDLYESRPSTGGKVCHDSLIRVT